MEGRLSTIDGRTRLAFVLGHPVGHSLSPVMHQAAIAAAGINAVYLPWSVSPARLPDAVRGLRSMEHLLGANLTVPHKEAVVPLLDGLTDRAKAIGAVNTLLPESGRLIGDNTDGAGLLAALRDELALDLTGATVILLGAGGAARAAAVSLAQAGIRALTLVNRTPERASHLADLVAAQAPDCAVRVAALRPGWEPEVGAGPHLLVNTTSVGLAPADPPLFDYRALAPPLSVVDLIYNPAETPLLHAARARGCRAGNGLGMLLHQGALAFARWTGRPAPLQAMREALQRAMPGHFA